MQSLSDSDLKTLRNLIPTNSVNPVDMVSELFRQGRRDMVFYFMRAKDVCRTQFETYRSVLKEPFNEVVVANTTRFFLRDYVRLWEFLNKRDIPVPLYLLAQTETLKRPWQVRGMQSDRSLVRFQYWIEREVDKDLFFGDAAEKLATKIESLATNEVASVISEFRHGARYIAKLHRRSGISLETILHLEAWHLPGGFLIGCPLALSLAESDELDDRAAKQIKKTIHALMKRGNLDLVLERIYREPEFEIFNRAALT